MRYGRSRGVEMAERVTRKSVEDLMRNPEILRAQSEVRAAEATGMRSLPQPMGGSPTVTAPSPAATGITRRQQYGPPPNLPASPLQSPVPMSAGATMAAPQMSPMAAQPMRRATMGSAPTASRVQPAPRPTAQNISDRIRSGYYNQAGAQMGPDPADVMAARQRLAATQAGGVPISQARALSEGRQDAAARIANAKGRAMLPSAPSPLDGSAAFFQGMNERSAADRAEADTAWNAKMDRYRASRDADTNNNGIPDRDEAVASKYGNMGINNVNDLSDASAKYRNYLRAYRDSGVRGKARAMNFDEFAKGLQEQEKQLPVFDLAAASNVAPRERARPSEQRVAAAQERSRLNELTVMGQNQGLNPMAARQFALATLSNEKQLGAMQGETQAQRAAAQALQETEAGARTSVAQIQAEQAATAARNQMSLQDMQFQERMAAAQAQNELEREKFGLAQQQMERENQRADLGLAMKAQDPAIAYQDTLRVSTDKWRQLYPNDPQEVQRLARADAELAYNAAVAQRSPLRRAGVDVGEDTPMPTDYAYTPPRASVDMNSEMRPATAQEIIRMRQLLAERNGGRPISAEEIRRELKDSNLMITKETGDELASYAAGEGQGFLYSQLPGARKAYEELFGAPAPKRNLGSWATTPYNTGLRGLLGGGEDLPHINYLREQGLY